MQFNLVWLLLFLPIFIHSTDPQSSTENFQPEWNPDSPPSPLPTDEPQAATSSPSEPTDAPDPPDASVNLNPILVEKVPEQEPHDTSGAKCERTSETKEGEGVKKTDDISGENVQQHDVESQIPATPSQGEEEKEIIMEGDEHNLLVEPDTNLPLADSAATTAPEFTMPVDGEKTVDQREDEDNKTAKTEEIPSFSEWTKLQLLKKQEAALLQPNGIVRENKKEDGKNFASPDCGAKILLANPEAQNPSGLLSSSHDEYMLNRCGVSSWIVMELCEPIRIEKVSMGNLELFSSSPKEVDVGVSDRFPTREWVKIGPLELPDSRAVHSFTVSGNSSYSKFVRIQILSHHGNEHYCPLSVIRIYGKSEYEVLQEVTHSDEDDLDHPESALDEGTPISEGTNEKSVIGSAADAVINIVKKAVNVLGKRDNKQGSLNTSDNCQSVSDCLSGKPSQLNVSEVCGWRTVAFVQERSRYFSSGINCHLLLQNNSIGSPSTIEGFWRAVFGEGILLTACNYETPSKNCSTDDPEPMSEPSITENGNAGSAVDTNVTNGQLPPPIVVPKQTTENIQATVDSNISTEKPASPPPVVVEEEAKQVQKESVFVRLTNKIKSLERNQSLSSGYLEELSQRFKKQSEESYSVSQVLKKSLNETLSKYKWLQEFTRRESSYLRRSIGDLRVTLWRTEMQRGFLILVALVQFLGICLFCCWTRRKISQLEEKITPQSTVRQTKPAVALENRRESHQIIPRKRSNSHPDLLKTKKKKKKKENSLKNAENIFSFVPHSATAPAGIPLKILSSSNGVLTNTNQLNISPTTPSPPAAINYSPGDSPSSMNRFGILASPSVKTINSLGSGASSNSTEELTRRSSEVVQLINGDRSGGSIGSLDSGGSVKSKKKKMKFKHLIPKLFEK